MNVGILGLATHLPGTVRTNDWWPVEVVDRWKKKAAANKVRSAEAPATEGVRRTLEAMAAIADDPFQGAVERRVLERSLPSAGMEIAAARAAVERSGISPSEIDLLLTYTQIPDRLNAPTAFAIHRELGLSPNCFTMVTDVACNAFLMQMALADVFVRSGRARNALLVQCGNVGRITPPEEQPSAWFGDGAAAEVVGPVADGFGLLGSAHMTDGAFQNVLVYGCPGRNWYDDGKVVLYSEDPAGTFRMLLSLADWSKQVVTRAMEQAAVAHHDVGFYASHQATTWLRAVTQAHIGLDQARSVDTFPWAGSLGAANVPLQLDVGQREGLLRRGDLVAMFAGGSGVTSSGLVLRWGT